MIAAMIYLFTDFGGNGPYVGQVKAVLAEAAPGQRVIDLMHDAPVFDNRASAYLLGALAGELPPGGVVLGVVDPDVGRSGQRAVVMRARARWYVGPDNGLFAVVAHHAGDAEWWEITWRPERLSDTFHGRDLFAPVAGMLASGAAVPGRPMAPAEAVGADWPDDLGEVIYVDHYGNVMTGIRAFTLPDDAVLKVADVSIAKARIFAEVMPGDAIWYENSCGMVEIALNKASAAKVMGLHVGAHVLAVATT
jgi:S-adenosylmethionine hydrolase